MQKIRLGILKNQLPDDHLLWIKACEDYSDEIEYEVIDLTAYDWYEKISSKRYDFLLAKPPGLMAKYKQLYDERIFLVDTLLNLPIYPSPSEIYIYENKKFFYSWLKANNLPHPKTEVFYNKSEALEFLSRTDYPFIAKHNFSASGGGVEIITSPNLGKKYIERSFSSRGVPRRWGPNWAKGKIFSRGLHYIKHPNDIKKKAKVYDTRKNDIQDGFVIFQQHIPHKYEWRIVVIADSYFGHKKLKIKGKASGSTLMEYSNPPLRLFDFAKDIMTKFNFKSQAIDVFEEENDKLLINEMQCIFGQADPYQMLVNGKPGRYVFQNGMWIFEEGMFNTNLNYDLRLKHAIEIVENRVNDESSVCL